MNKKTSIAKQFVIHVISIIVIATLSFSIILSFFEYKNKIKNIDEDINKMIKSNLYIIKKSLWIGDLSAIELILRGFLYDKDILYAEIKDEKNHTIAKAGKILNSNNSNLENIEEIQKTIIKKEIPLFYKARNKNFYIGKLTIIATKSLAIKEVQKFVFYIFLQSLLLIIITSLYIIYIFHKFISQHIFKISNYLEEAKIETPIPKLKLDRKEKYKDELSDIVNSINNMLKKANKNYQLIKYQAYHDSLTGLLNRKGIENRVQEIIKSMNFYQNNALFLIDINNFKIINDSLGHNIGDEILKEISKRLLSLSDNKNDVGRLSSDVFLMIKENIDPDLDFAKEKALNYAKKISEAIQQPIYINNKEYILSASIGIKIFNKTSNFSTILKHADNALYNAKNQGIGEISIFLPKMEFETNKRMYLETELRNALKNNENITINFQPKCDITGKILSAESLMRIKSKTGNIIPPYEIIPIAEETGLIDKLERQIMEKVFNFIQKNLNLIKNSTLKSIAINISPTHFIKTNFCNEITNLAKKYNIPKNFIMIEITEEASILNLDQLIKNMNSLKQEGFGISIDDFGTGYSSFKYIQQFPLDELKIDKSFIDKLLINEKNNAIVKTIISLAHNLNCKTVAEGVENNEQLKMLEKYKCDLIQGYIFFKPLTEEEFLKKLINSNE